MINFTCPVCGNHEHTELYTSEQHEKNGHTFTIENILTYKCTQCKELSFPFASLEYIEKVIEAHNSAKSI